MLLGDVLQRIIARRWIAGPDISDAMIRARALNGKGIIAIINYLGEELDNIRDVDYTVKVYKQLIRAVKSEHVKADITVKASQLGLRINNRVARRHYGELAKLCKKNRLFLWLDMEEYELVSRTIDLYLSAGRTSGRGICIQSYLRRSRNDLIKLAKCKAVIRLVKGAHAAANNPVYESRDAATENYYALMEYLFKNCNSFTIGTHDSEIINNAFKLNRKYKRDVTYAMLNGIRDQYAAGLAKHNKVAVYVPFGRRWFGYSYRRIKELNNMKLILTSIAKRGN